MELGCWYGNNPTLRVSKQEEIDVLGFGYDKSEMIIGESKWRNEPIDVAVLQKLQERSEFFPQPNKELFLFSKSGFSDRIIQIADDLGNLFLIEYSTMYD
jgi:hypothetical protein